MSYSVLRNLKDALDISTDIFLGDLPSSPTNVVVLRQIGGVNNITQEVGLKRGDIISSSVNVFIRLEDVAGAFDNSYNILDDIVEQVSQFINTSIGDKAIIDVLPEEIGYIGKDKKGNHTNSVDINIQYSKV